MKVVEDSRIKVFAKQADLILVLDLNFVDIEFPREGEQETPAQVPRGNTGELRIASPRFQFALPEDVSIEDSTLAEEITLAGAPSGNDVESREDADPVNDHHDDKQSDLVETHVSAVHLIEASKYFETLLAGRFLEAGKVDTGAMRRIPLQDIYAPAFILLMDIVHSRYHRLPAHIDAEMLFQLCILIDMYAMHESTTLQSYLWFQRLIHQIPVCAAANLHHWAFICYVLRKSEQFRAVTAILQRYYVDSDNPCKIPLPSSLESKSCQSVYINTDSNQPRCSSRATTLLHVVPIDYRLCSMITEIPLGADACMSERNVMLSLWES